MAQTAANLVDHVLPSRTPLRQFVLTLPFELRARLAYDAELLGAVTRLFVDSVLGFYRRRLSDTYRIDQGQSGAVTVVQRCSGGVRLNPHLHTIALDGVFVRDQAGALVFHQLPSLANAEVADLLQTVRARVLALLERRGVIESRFEPRLVDDGSAERDPAVALLASAAVTGHPPAGPERRHRPVIALRDCAERSVSVEASIEKRGAATAGRAFRCSLPLLGADDLDARVDGEEIRAVGRQDWPCAVSCEQHDVSVDGIPRSARAQHHADDLAVDAAQGDHLDLGQEHGHGRLPTAAPTPDLRHDSAGRDQRHVCAEETREELRRVPLAPLERDERAGVEHHARSGGRATPPSCHDRSRPSWGRSSCRARFCRTKPWPASLARAWP